MIYILLIVALIIASLVLTYSHVKTLSLKIVALEAQMKTLEKRLEEKTVN